MTAARPETGATEQQIEEATQRLIQDRMAENKVDGLDGQVRPITAIYAGYLVPPTHVIALAEHVTDAADREAIGRALHVIESLQKSEANDRAIIQYQYDEMLDWALEELTPDDLARLERLRGSGGEETT